MPKLQAGCTLSAQEGMVVKTARTSEQAAEGQNSTLEFILVNHPLDCPVCDKGGECPLQDLTFRYGPGNTRMTFPKRTFEKPIPISPLIALDRERCILCYRCTRFSEQIAEDGQLVAINRGAQSVIATFEDEPYVGHFSGNVTELCPVGALTSTQYRFEARPWEIQNVPTVCGHCPVGCNTTATTREGKVKRILSRNHPEIDEGWLCDKGRFAYAHLDARDRITTPLRKAGPRRFEELSWEDALDQAERMLRAGGATTLTALSGSESVEEAYALGRLLRAGLGANEAVLPEVVPDSLDAYRAPLSDLRDAKTIAVLCDEPVVERAPVVELWLKAARRKGATITYGAPDGPVDALVTDQPNVRLGARDVYYLPRTPNGRGVTDAWSAAGDGEAIDAEPTLLVISGDEAATDPSVRALAERADVVIGIGMFEESFRGLADLVLPGTSYLERDGTTINLEGRLQRQRRAVLAPVPDVLAWVSKLAERFDVAISPHVSVVFEEISECCFG
ncbi:MAG TPA: molybdopterin-dependent oxidoreductase, partial [Gaiellaceae bacterium]